MNRKVFGIGEVSSRKFLEIHTEKVGLQTSLQETGLQSNESTS